MNKISIKKACEIANISRPTIYKYINNGMLSVVKDGKNTFIEPSELFRVFPNAKLINNEVSVNDLHQLTSKLTHKDELISILKKQLDEKQQDCNFLKEQLTIISKNFTQTNTLLEDTINKNKKKKKIFGIF